MSSPLQSSSDLDPRVRRWGAILKWGTLLVVGYLVAPYIMTAIGGLLGLGVSAVVLLGMWALAPSVQLAGQNLRLRLLKGEAARDPVSTLQGEYLRQSKALEDRKTGLETMSGAIRTLAETIRKLKDEFPDSQELPQMQQDYADLQSLEKSREQSWQDAYVALGDFAKEIKRASRIWDVAQAAAKARQQSGLTEDEWTAKLKTETSLDAIRTKLNTQLAALTTEKMQADADRILKGRVTVNMATPKAALPSPDDHNVIDIAVIAAPARRVRVYS